MATISGYPKQLVRRLWHIHRQIKISTVSQSDRVRWMNTHRVGSLYQRLCSLCCRSFDQSRNLATISKDDGMGDWMFSSDFRPAIDLDYLAKNAEVIADRISHRKGNIDVQEVLRRMKEFQHIQEDVHDVQIRLQADKERGLNTKELEHTLNEKEMQLHRAENNFYQIAVAIPNSTHPNVHLNEDAEPVLIEEINEKRSFDFPIKGHVELGEELDIIRLKNLGHTTGHRSYFLKGAGAMLEDALVRFTLDRLIKKHGFKIIKVPDIIKPVVFEGCGMRTIGLHTQVYCLSSDHHDIDMCLAGTAEVGIAGYLMNRTIPISELPMKIAAMSRCYRAETAHSADARGLYRVHQFTKVEMFCVAANERGDESEEIFHEFVGIQRDLFRDLGLHFQILDMPAYDLGAPAYRKFDMEAWMPHRKAYGEVSSTSNCTDFQSRRLHIQYKPSPESPAKYVHTLNGTACAVPRLIIAILENNQQRDGSIVIPKPLQPYMDGMREITRPASGKLHFTRL
ncbi:serine--tRNA ligase, mitochondrial-like [Lytechinus pictus]|uniref:serine--tRNA ligase, mitochondrial-like n=1 Tax=Lytechinus pictus TaxID=7653 RepID=UPI0030B9F8AF